MTVIKTANLRTDFKRVAEIANSGEVIVISRPLNKNLVVIREQDYKDLTKAARNGEYVRSLEESYRQYEAGNVVVKTIDELEAMAQ
ncbi:MAG: type II toxin-antitoxin system Phd/YefM family antitoxin [Oscillospiraceae bacterium]|nr:type II toxin-antitoxin system Phd/YefM family antitoxin [Oscillospiraceae bacterium]